jgi:hypothetical protein
MNDFVNIISTYKDEKDRNIEFLSNVYGNNELLKIF